MSMLRRNIVWLLISQVLTWMVSIIILVLAPNKLDAEGFGRISFVTAYVGFFLLVGSLGSAQYYIKEISRDHDLVPGLVRTGLRLKLVLGLALSVLAMALAWVLGYRGETLVMIAIACIGMIGQMLNEIFVGALAGMHRMARSAMWQTAQVYISTLAGIIIVLTTKSLVAYTAAFSLAIFVPLVANYATIRPYLAGSRGDPVLPWKPIVVGGVPLLMLTVLNLVYGTVDIPILDAVSGNDTVGWYSVAYKWVSMPIFITTIVVSAFLPSLAALAKQSMVAFNGLTNRALRLVVFVTVPASAGLVFVSADLLDLVYDNKYDDAASLMQILSIHIPLAAIDTVLATALIAADRQNRYILVSAAAAVLNPPLAFAAIHWADGRYANGAIGASIVTVITEGFIMVCALRMRPRGVVDRATLSFCIRATLASAIMCAPLLVLADASIFVKVAVGGVVFTAASVALRLVSPSSVKAVIADIGKARSGGTVELADGGNDEMSQTGAEQ